MNKRPGFFILLYLFEFRVPIHVSNFLENYICAINFWKIWKRLRFINWNKLLGKVLFLSNLLADCFLQRRQTNFGLFLKVFLQIK